MTPEQFTELTGEDPEDMGIDLEAWNDKSFSDTAREILAKDFQNVVGPVNIRQTLEKLDAAHQAAVREELELARDNMEVGNMSEYFMHRIAELPGVSERKGGGMKDHQTASNCIECGGDIYKREGRNRYQCFSCGAWYNVKEKDLPNPPSKDKPQPWHEHADFETYHPGCPACDYPGIVPAQTPSPKPLDNASGDNWVDDGFTPSGVPIQRHQPAEEYRKRLLLQRIGGYASATGKEPYLSNGLLLIRLAIEEYDKDRETEPKP